MTARPQTWQGEIARRAKETLERLQANPTQTKPTRLTVAQLAAMIDHTLLKAEATPAMVDKLCGEASEYRFASVCVNSCNVARCARALQGSGVLVCSVVGFPLGANVTLRGRSTMAPVRSTWCSTSAP
jgi:hypothetical protein